MLRQVGIGAAAVLSVGLLAAGCSEDGDTINAGGSGNDLLNNLDQIGGLNAVGTNALAPDGGGLSENASDTAIDQVKVVFNCDCCDSDGTFGGDDTAIVLFQSKNNTGTQYQRVYATHFNGSFTPPVELTGSDRDDRVAVNLSSYVAVPMNTSAYQTGSTSNQDQVNQARANNGNWLILGDYVTFFTDPVLGGAGGNQTTTNARGARRVLGSWLFLNNQRANSIATVAVGAVTKTFRYGFQKLGEIVNTTFQGGGAGTNNVPATVGASKLAVPANHVTSYGAVSDTFCGQATFGGDALPFSSDGNTASPGVYNAPGGPLTATSTAFAFAIPHVSSSAVDPMATNDIANLLGLRAAEYHVGEQTNLIVAVWTQICNSFSGGGSFTSSAETDHQGGHELQLRFRTFNLATMTWENDEAEITGTVERNGATTNLRAGSAPFPHFKVYNNFLFAKYADASLNVEFGGVTNQNLLSLIPNTGAGQHDWFQTEVGGHEGGNMVPGAGRPGFWEEIIMAVRFVDDGDGTASLGSGKQDISSTAETRSAAGQHTTTNPTITNDSQVGDTYPDREMANFNGSGTSILGPDQGAGDITVFMIVSDGTNTTANPNIDRELIATGLNTDGTLVTGTNPLRMSGTHQEDYHGQAAALNAAPGADASGTNEQNNRTSLEDPLVIRGAENGAGGLDRNVASFTASSFGPTWFELVLNRTGEWAAIAFLKDTGLSAPATGVAGSFSQDLHAVAFQLFRPTTTGTGSTSTAAALNARVAGPTVVNAQNLTPPVLPGNRQGYPTTQAGGFSGNVTNDAEKAGNWRSLPVNDYRWQGGVSYRCGVQSDKDVLSILYEQSDATEDRVFIRQIRITPGATGTPTLALQGAASTEIDANDQIASHRSFNEVIGGVTVAGGSTFRFIDECAQIENWQTIDAGLNTAGNGGECLVIYAKITDNTTTDGDHGDASVRALVFTGTALTGPIAIDNNVDENVAVVAAGDGDDVQSTAHLSNNRSVRNQFNNVGPRVHTVTVTPRNTDITNAPSFPNANAKVTIGIVLRDREINITTTAGVNTVTANASSRRALYARIFRNDDNALAFNGRFVPTADPAAFDFPLQLCHEQGIVDDTTFVTDSLKNGGVWWIIMEANSQLWLQELTIAATTLTRTFVSTGTGTGSFSTALSNPALITNDSSSDVLGQKIEICEDANGVQKAILIFFTKNDRDGNGDDVRLQVRAGGA